MPFSEDSQLIGFSTGALAFSDWREGLAICRRLGTSAIELSALRFPELQPLAASLQEIDLSEFQYISFHLPSSYSAKDESFVQNWAAQIVERGWPVVLHPDAIVDFTGWQKFGNKLLIENMDKRKPRGRVVEELLEVFESLPEAGFCFDYGHARQVDPTMSQASRLIEEFGSRLQQIHFSDVDSSNHHRPLNQPALTAFETIRLPVLFEVPVILETTITEELAGRQVELTREFFSRGAQCLESFQQEPR